MASREIEKSLENHDTSKCLMWCQENRSKLRKQKSTMEFNLRVQDFIELVRSDKRLDAVKYARKHFASVEMDYASLIQQCMALLAFPIDTRKFFFFKWGLKSQKKNCNNEISPSLL